MAARGKKTVTAPSGKPARGKKTVTASSGMAARGKETRGTPLCLDGARKETVTERFGKTSR